MAEAASAEKPKKPHRHRVALVVTALLVAFVVLTLPFVIFSIVVELLGKPEELRYSLTAERPLLPALAGNRQQSGSYLNILIDDLDEAKRVATLRISGQRACATNCPALTIVFVSAGDDAAQRAAMPPSASISIRSDARIVDETIHLPVRGQPSLYPFDTYQLWLGIMAYATGADGAEVPLHAGDLDQHANVTLQAQLAHLTMRPPVTIEPSRVHVVTDPYDFLVVKALYFQRPYYLQALAVLLVLLIAASGFFALFMRPIHDLFLGIGGVILGVWGVRSVIVQGNLPYVTAIDLALSAVILFLLLALAIRAVIYFHQHSDLHLPWTRGPS